LGRFQLAASVVQYGQNYTDTFSWIHNNHSIKIGVRLLRSPTENINTSNYIPSYTFNDVLSFVNDKPLQMTRWSTLLRNADNRQSAFAKGRLCATFIQDDWKVRAQPDH